VRHFVYNGIHSFIRYAPKQCTQVNSESIICRINVTKNVVTTPGRITIPIELGTVQSVINSVKTAGRELTIGRRVGTKPRIR